MKAFTEHPQSVGETYFGHMKASFSFGGRMFMASLGCFLHGIFPFLCVKTGSSTIRTLNYRMVSHRDQSPAGCEAREDAFARFSI